MRNLETSILFGESVVQFWSLRRGGLKCELWFALVSGPHKNSTVKEKGSVKADPIFKLKKLIGILMFDKDIDAPILIL